MNNETLNRAKELVSQMTLEEKMSQMLHHSLELLDLAGASAFGYTVQVPFMRRLLKVFFLKKRRPVIKLGNGHFSPPL